MKFENGKTYRSRINTQFVFKVHGGMYTVVNNKRESNYLPVGHRGMTNSIIGGGYYICDFGEYVKLLYED